MTETTVTPDTRYLFRDADDKKVAGVCAALGRYTDTDPVIWRILAVVLTVFGGTGLLLYILGWLLIPKRGEPTAIAERWLRRDHRTSPAAIAVIVVVACLLFAGLDDGDGLAALAVLGVVGYLVHRDRQGRPLLPPYVPPADGSGWPAPSAEQPDAPAPVLPPRTRSRLGQLTLSLAALVTGLMVLARTYGADGLTPARIVAAALVVVAGGLVVGTWYGRARWLAFVGLLLCVALAATVATDDSRGVFRGGLGERTWVVDANRASQGFRLGIGEATLDLTGLPPEGQHLNIRARIGAGHLIVLVPDDVPIRVRTVVRVGEISEFGESLGGGADRVERTRRYGPSEDPRVDVELTVDLGEVEVRRG